MSDIFPNSRHGVLKILSSVDGGYYKFIDGVDQDGQRRQLVTRGPGKEKAATRIPILLPAEMAADVIQYAHTLGINIQTAAWRAFRQWWQATKIFPQDKENVLMQLKVPLIKMPRAGNLVTGLEYNAPGGTGNAGESLEQIAAREFDEEADVAVIGTESPFPPGMPASGIYDEVQQVSFALISGNPTKLVEGGKGWQQVPLVAFRSWAISQNQTEDPDRWQTPGEYVPVDGKVVTALWFLTESVFLNDW